MRPTRPRPVLGVLGSLCLLAFSVQGVGNVMDNGLDLAPPTQWLMSASQAAYAAVGLLAIVCWWRQSRLTRALLLLWGTL
ncbi:MAG: hypothetical protein MUE41_13730, partial [Gemmatimonadaceae bacterium]|nr:hypothetical protein [Gemmatimonadaceae bacterium]